MSTLKPEALTFGRLWGVSYHVSDDVLAQLAIGARKKQRLNDDELDHLLLARLPNEWGDWVYDQLGLKRWAWPLERAK